MWVLAPQSLDTVRDDLARALTLANGVPVYALSAAECAAIEIVYRLYEDLCGQPDAELRPAALDAVIPPESKGLQKWNFLGKMNEEISNEDKQIR